MLNCNLSIWTFWLTDWTEIAAEQLVQETVARRFMNFQELRFYNFEQAMPGNAYVWPYEVWTIALSLYNEWLCIYFIAYLYIYIHVYKHTYFMYIYIFHVYIYIACIYIYIYSMYIYIYIACIYIYTYITNHFLSQCPRWRAQMIGHSTMSANGSATGPRPDVFCLRLWD